VIAGTRITVALPGLAPHASHEAAYLLPTGRRGRYTVEPLVIGHSDPLRLFRVGRRCGERSTLYVHPRIHHIPVVASQGVSDLDGRASSYAGRGGVAFHSLRGYQPGDPWRLIHWKSTARFASLMVRHNVAPEEPRHLVVLDTSAASYPDESFEDAVRTAASLCSAFARGGSAVSIRTTGGRVVPEQKVGRSGGDATAALDLLADVQPAPDDPGLPALSGLVPDHEGVGLIVVTGQPEHRHLSVLPAIRPRFLALSLLEVGHHAGRAPAGLTGVVSASVRTSDEVPAAWAQLVGT
jgi:uncharacterized protein (DUF58 family)